MSSSISDSRVQARSLPRSPATGREWTWVVFVSLLILLATIAPNLWLYLTTGPDFRYSGFLYGWDDGSSYLATMREGARGEWLYTLPYSPEPTSRMFLFEHYLLLGQLNGWLRLEPIVVFQLARLAGGAFLLLSLYAFIGRFFQQVEHRRMAFLLAALGSGFGWLALLWRQPTPDLWQAEMFPFLSILANAHFPWAMGALLWLFHVFCRDKADTAGWLAKADVIPLTWGSLFLSIVQPYALVIVGIVVGVSLVIRTVIERRVRRDGIIRFGVVLLVGGLFALYYRWALGNIPSFAAWDRQDITLSPPIGDYLIAGGIVLALAVIGAAATAARSLRQRTVESRQIVLWLWPLTSLVLMYLPLSQHQRRFAFALFIPIAVLAAQSMTHVKPLNERRAFLALFVLSALTNFVLVLVAFSAAQQHPSYLFFTRSEWNGLMYLRANAAANTVVLTSPEMGLFVPAWSDQRVFYGHPNETLNAKVRREQAEKFFMGQLADADVMLSVVDYIFVGPRERQLGTATILTGFRAVFSEGDVTIYARR